MADDSMGQVDLKRKWPKAMSFLADVVEAALLREGRSQEEARDIAEVAVMEMAFVCGGRSIYLPKGHSLKAAIKHRQIFKEFTGANILELAEKHELTEVQIYAIISQQRELRKASEAPSQPKG